MNGLLSHFFRGRDGDDHLCLADFLKRFYLFIFREREKEGEREGEKHQCVVASHVAPYYLGPGLQPRHVPDWESNWWPVGLQPTLNPLSYTSQDCLADFDEDPLTASGWNVFWWQFILLVHFSSWDSKRIWERPSHPSRLRCLRRSGVQAARPVPRSAPCHLQVSARFTWGWI